MKNIIKELLVSFIITIVLIFLLSVAVYSTELNENYIDFITIGIVCLSLLIAGARLAKSKKEKGIAEVKNAGHALPYKKKHISITEKIGKKFISKTSGCLK